MKYNSLKIVFLVVCSFFTLQACKDKDTLKTTNNNSGAGEVHQLDGDYQHIIFYGQSLAMGWESPEAITTRAMDGNLMLGNNPNIKYSSSTNTFNSLVATKWVNGGEQPIVAAINAFSYHYRTEVRKGQKFIGTTAGEGGMSIERLSKEFPATDNLYNATFLKSLTQAKTLVNNTGSSIACPAIVYMQGEFNYTPANKDLGMNGGDAVTSKNEYKALLLTLKNNMQNDVMQTYGQKVKPLFFIYQVAGHYITNREMTINMAQLEFALENNDVVLLNPTYFASDYNGGHLSTNGYRWYGEVIAKSLYQQLIKKQTSKPVYPLSYDVSGNTIAIKFHVPKLPLVLDNWTTKLSENYGFSVYKNGNKAIVKQVSIDGDKVIITCEETLTGKIEVNYAGNERNGNGNLRDSEYFASYYSYQDTPGSPLTESYTPKKSRTSTEKIYGSSYPLQNWCVPFYYAVTK